MIFNKCCDSALWLILAGEEKNKCEFVEFIKSIPYELYEKIMKALVQFEQYERDNVDILDREILDLSEELFFSNNYKYWFNVDMILGTLKLGRSFNGIKEIEITVFLSSKNVKNDDRVLGYVNYGSLMVYYELINTVLGDRVVSSCRKGIKRYKKVDIDKIPENIDVVDLEKKNRFVRSKCRKRF